ncbi:TonB C-terminal domain-containing protein [Arenimonas fontis]|uniref:TonB C-terminal domain-containing protein n=1 Tax=Arenimonas fontis TaxID=2608255 RepID=A0A5B2ZA48_9GAMM|nr:TonB C-terminal domain-containing protein [Arenimonas fontis]KAA2284899.1 TonB C-terminal domain-containing protein [Arenimonas fontis]
MHADALQRPRETEDLAPAVTMALALHVGLAAVLLLAGWLEAPPRRVSVAGPVVEAALVISAADLARAERAAETPRPQEVAPPPQPRPEPRPQDSPAPPQPAPQEQLPVPDTREQEAAARLALEREQRAREEAEERRRQEQADLTERRKQEEAERRQRLREQQLAQLQEIRRQREEAARRARLEEQRLQQLADREAEPTPSPAPAARTGPVSGNEGTDTGLLAQYKIAMHQTAHSNWNRVLAPERVRCEVRFTQIPGGEVINVEFIRCPYDAQGRESVERALRRSPMPYQGFESVFERQVTLTFCYPEEACR